MSEFGFSTEKEDNPNGNFSSSNSVPREDTTEYPVIFPAPLNANVIDVEKGKKESQFYVESNAAVPSSSKVPFVSRILPISRKSSQVVPTYGSNDQSSVVSIESIQATDIITAMEVGVRPLKSSSPEKKMSESRITARNSPVVVTIDPKDEASIETSEDVCRICHDNPSRMTLLSPCLCKGSMGKVHRTCLERWLGESAKTSCEICGHEYETERRPRYKGWRSIVAWIRHPLNPTDTRNFFFDLACFFVLTPLAAISAWLCVVGAQHYSYGPTTLDETNADGSPYHEDKAHHISKLRNKNVEASNATWTSIGLLTLTGTLLAAYYVWLFVAVRYHIQVWRDWQARNYVVTISPLNSEAVQKLRELREAAAHAESETVDQRQHQTEPVTESNLTPSLNNNANNNNNNNSNSGSESGSNGKKQTNPKEKQQPQNHKAFASVQETDLDDFDAIKMEELNCAGPSHCSNNNGNTCNPEVRKDMQIPPEAGCSNKEFDKRDSNTL